MKLFTNTSNKIYIRNLDKMYIDEEFIHHGKKLVYFGLPSEGLYDIIEWKDYIDAFVAVERGQKSNPSSKQNLLITNAIRYGIHLKMTLLRGEINEIIINDKDEVGQNIPYPFELVNFDYGGSILYPDRIRTDAIRIFIRRQRPIDFLFFITSNIREFDIKELLETQDRISSEILSFLPRLEEEISKYFEWINRKESLIRQILHLHFMIKYLSETNHYEIECFPAINYEGSKETQLLHYIFRLRFREDASTRVISNQSLIDLLNQNHQKLIDDKLVPIESPPFKIKI